MSFKISILNFVAVTGRDPYTGEVYHSEETDETAEGEVKKEE